MILKSKYYPIVVLGLITLIFGSCQSKKTADVVDVPAPVVEVPAYPALGNQEISHLYSVADHVDIIFYNLPMSVSQEDPASVKNTVMYITPASPKITGQCNPMGRLTWISQGAIIKEADIFATTGCEYLLFMDKNQPVAANAMAKEGVDFFKNIMNQFDKRKK